MTGACGGRWIPGDASSAATTGVTGVAGVGDDDAMNPHAPHVVRRVAAAAALLALATGCSTASDPSPPAGVDELTVPTPSADPADFVEEIDNPWFPLAPGASWSYEVTGGEPAEVRTVTATDGPDVGGVATTALTTTSQVPPGDVVGETIDFFAQDSRGNVWWFGRSGEWQAGEDGAEAGIAMLATPRVGDGYREALVPGVDGNTAQVAALDGTADTVLGELDDMVVIDVSLPGGVVQRSFYARGAGRVVSETLTGAPEETLELSTLTIQGES